MDQAQEPDLTERILTVLSDRGENSRPPQARARLVTKALEIEVRRGFGIPDEIPLVVGESALADFKFETLRRFGINLDGAA